MVDPFIYIYRMKEVKLALRRSGYWLCGGSSSRRRTMTGHFRPDLYGATHLTGRRFNASQMQASSRSHTCASYATVQGDDNEFVDQLNASPKIQTNGSSPPPSPSSPSLLIKSNTNAQQQQPIKSNAKVIIVLDGQRNHNLTIGSYA